LERNKHKGGTVMKDDNDIKEIIEFGDYYLVTTNDNKEYDGQIVGKTETTLTIEWWNQVKNSLCETDIAFSDIKEIAGFNDSQM
jgi:hypothetical protein